MITKEFLLNKYQNEFGLTLVPLKHTTKKPDSKFTGEYDDEGKQIWSWKKSKGITYSDDELLAARSWGVDHDASGTLDVDFDDKLFHAHKFSSMLPDTHSVGKMLNGSGIPTTNHKLFFKPENVEVKTESYPKTIRGKGEKIIELLPNTQSRYVADDLYITHDIPPKRLTESEFQQVRQATKEIYFMAKAVANYPANDSNQRNEYALRLAGVLAHHSDWSLEKKEDVIRRIAEAANDDDVPNRVSRVSYQEQQLKDGEEVVGIPALVNFLGADAKEGLDWIDVIKKEKTNKSKTIIFHTSEQFSKIEFPKPVYILEPYIREQRDNF